MASRIGLNFSGLPRSSFFGRIARLPLQWIPRSTVLPILQGPLRGARWIAGSATHGCWLGSYEADKQLVFKAAVHPGSVVYDVGANVGFYTLLASRLVGPAGAVYAFEPFPDNIAHLQRHLALNNVSNVTLIEAAVSSESGEMGFSPGEFNEEGQLSSTGSLRVRVVSLDDLVRAGAAKPPTMLKIDVEGAELDVLRGSEYVLAQYQPLIFLATHNPPVHQACCDFLKTHGYSLTTLDEGENGNTHELRADPILIGGARTPACRVDTPVDASAPISPSGPVSP
jgi:FkbM family methyltransferase